MSNFTHTQKPRFEPTIVQAFIELDAIKALLGNRFDYYQAAGQLTPYLGCEQ